MLAACKHTVEVNDRKLRLEKHEDKTEPEYVWLCLAAADDHVSVENQNKKTTEDDEKKREQSWLICSKILEVKMCDMSVTPECKKTRSLAVVQDSILKCQKNTKAKKHIYEVKCAHKPAEFNTWVKRDTLLAMGYSKIITKISAQEAEATGLLQSQ